MPWPHPTRCRARARLPSWMRPGGQEPYRFHRLSSDEGVTADGAAVSADGGGARPAGRWCPEETAGFLSRLSFSWVNSLIGLGYR